MWSPTELVFDLYKIPLSQDLDPSKYLLHRLHEERSALTAIKPSHKHVERVKLKADLLCGK